jgi:hypothetical protein
MRGSTAILIVAITIGAGVVAARANDVSSERAAAALAACNETEHLPNADRQKKIAYIEHVVEMGEAAVAADEKDSRAHLALFCALGKQVELAGLSWRVFGRVQRVRSEAERTVELAPRDPDALVAKGELLRRLPAPLGGDRAEGLALLKRAVAIKPNHVAGRIFLARALADDKMPEARREAYQALAVAKASGTDDDRTQAQNLIASLGE